ncbi:Secreted and surface protein containing fasciclin-like repeats [Methanosarcina sp. MTP4]|uniref:fasciclin domain-containing protein n=1 Tax=Methanosarcina sp. MTP4 TaxID=1434100 RepID=UPI00061579AF|nr:fasciclin domain-containing protein [Methanosarcina sp. MTP4]AKB25281.1 Secreted and surface protein containing fasciclin-like repeats [Methanosarcina sp. MTP4]
MLFASGCAEEQPEEEVEEPVDEGTEEEMVEEEEMIEEEEIAEEEEMAEEEMPEEEMPEEEEAVVEEEMAEQAAEGMAGEENITEDEMAEDEMAEDEMAEDEMAEDEMAEDEEEMNIVETAASSDDFDTLVTAVQTAGLEEALSGEGPFTIFAPTDDAFDDLPPGTLDDLLEDEDALTDVLLYHVAEGEFDVTEIESVETMQGEELPVDPTSDPITVGDANIIGDRIETSNGFIYPIDEVLIPPE